jgi:hypothetical protein
MHLQGIDFEDCELTSVSHARAELFFKSVFLVWSGYILTCLSNLLCKM